MYRKILSDSKWVAPFVPELDIVVWAARSSSVADASQIASRVFAAAEREHLHLALARLPTRFFPHGTWVDQAEHDHVLCLRSVLMKPEHLAWLETIWNKLGQVTDEVHAHFGSGNSQLA